jgi:hypothetical protein
MIWIQGNNAIAYKGPHDGPHVTTKQSADGQVFNYSYDTSVGPITGQNPDAARVNTFFLSNIIHDVRCPPVLGRFYTKQDPRSTIVMGSLRRPTISRMTTIGKGAKEVIVSTSQSKMLEGSTIVSP